MTSMTMPNEGSIPPNGIGIINFTPNLAGNAIFLTFYVILLPIHLFLFIRFWRFYGYSIGMTGGILLEMLGYVAKVQLAHTRESKNGYIMYIIGLTLGPTFLSSALYLSISTLQRHLTLAQFKHVGPRLFATLFILGDFICLCFIGCGGSLAAIYWWSPIGVNLMIAGLAVQVLFTLIFCIILAIICRRVRYQIVSSRKTLYVIGSGIASVCLLLRSCWRAVELSDGFNGPLASKENIFFALDSLPVLIMTILLTGIHPEFWFNKANPISDKVMGIRLQNV